VLAGLKGHPVPPRVGPLQKRLRRALLSTQLGAALPWWPWAGPRREAGVRLDPRLGGPGSMYLVFWGLGLPGHPCWAACYPKAWVMHNPEVSGLAPAPVLESANRTPLAPASLLERLADWPALKLLGLPRPGRPWCRGLLSRGSSKP